MRPVPVVSDHPRAPETDQTAIRLGLASVRILGDDVAALVATARIAGGPYADIADLMRRVRGAAAHAGHRRRVRHRPCRR